jgi:hypothetical protein
MKQEDVTALAGLFNSTAENVNTAIENGTVSELINGFTTATKLIPMKDYPTLEANLKRQAFMELDKTNLPKEVFKYVKGAVLEQTEKGLADKYGITDYQNLDSLVEAIITTKVKTPSDDETKALKAQIVAIETKAKNDLAEVSKTFETRFIDTELRRVVGELPIDAEGAKLENQQEIVMAMVKQKFAIQLDGDKTVAYRDGKMVADSKLDPVPIRDVIADFAKDYVNLRPEQGGRGDQSSTNGSKTINFAEYCAKQGIKPNTPAQALAVKDLQSKGYTLE